MDSWNLAALPTAFSKPDDQDERFAGCQDIGVQIVTLAGRGNALVALRDFYAGESLLWAPCEHCIEIPTQEFSHADLVENAQSISHSSSALHSVVAAEAARAAQKKSRRRFSMWNDFAEVVALHQKYEDVMSPRDYWLALMSLTPDESGHNSRMWRTISEHAQSRLLLLHRPLFAGARDYAGNQYNFVSCLCSKFMLRADPLKIIELAKAVRYNHFGGTSLCGAPLAICEVAIAHANHSCAPTAFVRRRRGEGTHLIVACKSGIKAGQEVTISYAGDEINSFTAHTRTRRQWLALSWLFYCTCETCSDSPAPSCPGCASGMSAIVSRTSKMMYSKHGVDCHSCSRKDVQAALGFFYHCDCCNIDLCGYWPKQAEEHEILEDNGSVRHL